MTDYLFKETSFGGMFHLFEDSELGEWRGVYTRSVGLTKEKLPLKEFFPIVGDLKFEKSPEKLGQTHGLKFQGKFEEVNNGTKNTMCGHVQITVSSKKLEAFFCPCGGSQKECQASRESDSLCCFGRNEKSAQEWFSCESENHVESNSKEFTTLSLFPTQIRWVTYFNTQDYKGCGSLYTEKDSIFTMYNAGGMGVDVEHKGREDITEWWRAVIQDLNLSNMRAVPNLNIALNENTVWVSYSTVQFSKGKKGEEGYTELALEGTILGEVWIKDEKTKRWYVRDDLTFVKPSFLNPEVYGPKSNDEMEKKTLTLAGKYQGEWVQSFNQANWEKCTALYDSNATFLAVNGGGKGTEVRAEGTSQIGDWWQTAVEKMLLRNLRVDGLIGTKVIREDMVFAYYEHAYFGKKDEEKSVALECQILVEVWQKSPASEEWHVVQDFVSVKGPE